MAAMVRSARYHSLVQGILEGTQPRYALAQQIRRNSGFYSNSADPNSVPVPGRLYANPGSYEPVPKRHVMKCICFSKGSNDVGVSICCQLCGTLQHTECYYSWEEMTAIHQCVDCARADSVAARNTSPRVMTRTVAASDQNIGLSSIDTSVDITSSLSPFGLNIHLPKAEHNDAVSLMGAVDGSVRSHDHSSWSVDGNGVASAY